MDKRDNGFERVSAFSVLMVLFIPMPFFGWWKLMILQGSVILKMVMEKINDINDFIEMVNAFQEKV